MASCLEGNRYSQSSMLLTTLVRISMNERERNVDMVEVRDKCGSGRVGILHCRTGKRSTPASNRLRSCTKKPSSRSRVVRHQLLPRWLTRRNRAFQVPTYPVEDKEKDWARLSLTVMLRSMCWTCGRRMPKSQPPCPEKRLAVCQVRALTGQMGVLCHNERTP